jgi:hypothetical protein
MKLNRRKPFGVNKKVKHDLFCFFYGCIGWFFNQPLFFLKKLTMFELIFIFNSNICNLINSHSFKFKVEKRKPLINFSGFFV